MTLRGFLLFPGQGAQCLGMARDVYEAGGYGRALFDEASEILGFDLTDLVFRGDEKRLARTENCQPAILVASLALLAALRERYGLEMNGAAGLSLGEYTALVALESIDFGDAVRLVRRRGELMEEAARGRPSGMAAVLGLEAAAVERICQEASALGLGVVVAANYNAPGQIAISGDQAALAKACEMAKAAGAQRVMPLAVSGAFHSPLMEPARAGLRQALADTLVRPPRARFVNNADARELSDPDAIKDALSRQLVSAVRWEQSCRLLVESGETTFYEVGPGRVLQGLMKKIAPEARVVSVRSLADLEALN
ncbi:MAG: ACP S-malonyltransferase [Planctomycetota bacterium]|nr:ACP S-malonyltransferase [Planctomycetota bacterium]